MKFEIFRGLMEQSKRSKPVKIRGVDVNKWISLKLFHKDPAAKALVMQGHS